MSRQTDLKLSELKDAAEHCWRRGFTAHEIKEFLQIPKTARQISNWIEEWKQSEFDPKQTIFAADTRLKELIAKKDKNYLEVREMQILLTGVTKFDENAKNLEIAKVKKQRISGENRKDYEPRPRDENGELIKPAKKQKNDISHITAEMFEKFEKEQLWWHQRLSVDFAAKQKELDIWTRMLLKCRQAGQTFVESYIAFKRGVLTGDPHVFISMTFALSLQFRKYINIIAINYFDCEQFTGGSGNTPMTLYKDGKPHCDFYFVPPNDAGTQGKAGHLIMDECGYWANFVRLNELAKGITTQGYTVTYLTTPSSINHPFHEYWNGDWFNKYQLKADKKHVECSHKAFQKAQGYIIGGDNVARLAYDIWDLWKHDARFKEKVTEKSLRDKYRNPNVWKNILELQWINDVDSVFKITDLLPLFIEDKDFKEYKKPNPVCWTYDPSGASTNADQAGEGYTELPENEKDAFWFHEYVPFRSDPLEAHVNEFKRGLNFYNITHAKSDCTMGASFVLPNIEKLFPNVEPIIFNVGVKTAMVHKMQVLVHQKRFLFKKSMQDAVLNSFLSVKKGQTEKSNQGTYYWTRDSEGNHGELFVVAAMAAITESMVPDYEEKIQIKVF